MKIITEVSKIPVLSIVTKVAGSVKYVLKDKITIYGDSSLQKELKSDDGARFLVSQDNISIVSGDKEMVWHVTEEELLSYLTDKSTK
jgi:hypothetical protein